MTLTIVHSYWEDKRNTRYGNMVLYEWLTVLFISLFLFRDPWALMPAKPTGYQCDPSLECPFPPDHLSAAEFLIPIGGHLGSGSKDIIPHKSSKSRYMQPRTWGTKSSGTEVQSHLSLFFSLFFFFLWLWYTTIIFIYTFCFQWVLNH